MSFITENPPRNQRLQIWSWALYDWANSAFATTVIAGLFPVFYASFWRKESAEGVSTTELAFANAGASLVVALLAPILGAVADRGEKKPFLLTFLVMGVCATGALGFLGASMGFVALMAFVIANIGFAGANSFYDAMLVDVADESKVDFVSALGYSLGYLGGGLLFAVNVTMVQKPEWFGLSSKAQAVQLSFLTVAAWWALFSLPILYAVRERKPHVPGDRRPFLQAASDGITAVWQTFKRIRAIRPIFLFIIAYILYIDGVNTIIRMAVKLGADMGFDSGVLIKALLMTQFIAFPAALLFGKLGSWIGARTAIIIGLVVYVGVTIGASTMTEPSHFYILAGVVGLVQGGVQSLSRSFFTRLIPEEHAAEFFGFYNMLGKAAAIFGTTLIGVGTMFFGDPQPAILLLLILFIGGGVLLMLVPNPSKHTQVTG